MNNDIYYNCYKCIKCFENKNKDKKFCDNTCSYTEFKNCCIDSSLCHYKMKRDNCYNQCNNINHDIDIVCKTICRKTFSQDNRYQKPM